MSYVQLVACGFSGCTKSANPDECLCSGCNAVICEDHADAPWGNHDADDHKECSVCGEAGHYDGECPE